MRGSHNRLYYGDNLDVLRRYVASESVDLVYLDPPFNSNASYNVLFAEKGGTKATAQIRAFEDTWQWDQSSAAAYRELVESGGRVADALIAFRTFLGESDMLAYLAMMAPRLVELRRVLKPTGSIYLHCDPTASHYLKMLMDGIFGPMNFRNEVIWLRSKNPKGSQHGLTRFSPFTDSVLFFSRSPHAPIFLDQIRIPLTDEELEEKYPYTDEHGRYDDGPILRSDSMGPRPNLVYEYKGFTPGPAGWRVERPLLEAIDRRGNLHWTRTGGVRRKLRPEDDKGDPVGSFWGDIPPLNSQAQERLGYPTQKPEALVERIIRASSKEGDLVLDPFCGCGTTVAAAQKLNRRWIGIDITHLAIGLIKKRLSDAYGESVKDTYEVSGEPVSVDDAATLAGSDPYQFQWWALSLVDARPAEPKKGADRGIDGRRYFLDPKTGKTEQVIFSVKSGHVTVDHVRVLQAVVSRERATQGVLICMESPTRPMRVEAASAGVAVTSWGSFPKIQITTVADLMAGKALKTPPARQLDVTYPKAPKAKSPKDRPAEQPDLVGVDLKRRMKKAGLPDPGARVSKPAKTG